MSEPLREQFSAAVATVLSAALAAPQSWGAFPALTVERRYKILPSLSNKLRVLVLPDDGSHTPSPENREGDIDDVVAFVVLIQVNDVAIEPATWGARALDVCKRALRAGVDHGALSTGYRPIEFEPESVVLIPDGDGRFAEFILPCTARVPDNVGGEA